MYYAPAFPLSGGGARFYPPRWLFDAPPRCESKFLAGKLSGLVQLLQ
jgi:hypothetical protein